MGSIVDSAWNEENGAFALMAFVFADE